MEQLLESLTTGEIKSIDFDLMIDKDCYAQTSIMHATPRCKAFYCFRNDDTREDGEDRLSQESFHIICESLVKLLKGDNNQYPAPRLKYELTITATDKSKFTFKPQSGATHQVEQEIAPSATSLSATTLKAIINILTDHIAEYSILTPFHHYI